MFCRVIYSNNSFYSANVFESQTAQRYKYSIRKIHDKSFLYIHHLVQVIYIESSGKRGHL